jgi:beta-N-acetylhexosaminidase
MVHANVLQLVWPMMLRNSVLALCAFCFTAALLAPEPASARSAHRRYHATKYWARSNAGKLHRRWRVAIQAVPDPSPANAAFGGPAPAPRPLKVLTRDEILASDADRLERLGRRLIVGFQSIAEAKALVEKRAVAGIFVTDHNVQGRKADDIASDIRSLQDIRKAQGLPRLIVATDQEGGYVSRLSPPLKWQPSLGMLIEPLKGDADREKAVRAYAEAQAHELERLGVTMNFGPVVDLRSDTASRDDGETRIYWRAIDSDPYLVAKVAGWYCDALTKFNIICTLKHFPGLGRVARDTHVAPGEITASESQLELTDWLPFRRVMNQHGVATMLGHVRVEALDETTPASYSEIVVNAVRSRWQNDGLLVTDDLGMGAVTNSKDGIGGAALKALNAGVDLVLLSSTEKYFDIVMSALIEADSKGEIDPARQNETRERLKRYVFVDDQDTALKAPN